MKNSKAYRFLITMILLIPLSLSAQNKAIDKAATMMGASQVNITPEKPTLMAGYGARKTPHTSIHDELFASALYFTGEKTKILLITADLLGFSSPYVDELRKAISSKTGIPAENIMISAVHNHGGPATRISETDTLHTIDNYLLFLKEKLINLSVDASKKSVPVRMSISKGVCNMNINRRSVFADGSVGLGRNPDGFCDHDLVTAKFEDLNGKTLAVLVNWPCHGTVSGQDNYRITGDWPGAAARYIKEKAGKDVVVAITIGASGDINPIYGPGNSFKEIEAVGFHVANEAWKSAAGATMFPIIDLQAINAVMTLPGKKAGKDELPHTTYESGPDTEVRITLLKIGDLVLSGISGELMTEIGRDCVTKASVTAIAICWIRMARWWPARACSTSI